MGMRKVTAVLGGVTGVPALLWISSAASPAVFRQPRMTFEIALPHAEREVAGAPDGVGASGLRHGSGPAAPWYDNPAVLVTWATALLLAAMFTLALLWAVREVLRYRVLRRLRDERPHVDLLPDLLGEHVRAGQERLVAGEARNGIVAAWVALEDGATVAGLAPEPAETSQEFAQRAFLPWLPDPAPLDELAGLYRRARFRRDVVVTEADRARAAGLLADVVRQLDAHRCEVARA